MYNRLTDNDRHFWCFDLGARHTDWRPWSLILASGTDEHPGCYLMMRAFGWSLRLRLPRIIKPHVVKHKATTWDAATVARMGRDWYAEIFPREFGFSLSDGFLQIFLGPQTWDSLTTKSWCTHLPWTQWRHVRHSYYDRLGEHYWTEQDGMEWTERQRMQDACPTVAFRFADYDGTEIVATTRIEEREWRFGTGCFKWLSLFRRPKVRRSLDITFASEVGPEKGSWKGGLIGTGTDVLPGELHEGAFLRYCSQEHRSKYRKYRITYLGRCDG
ncbi:hypothetical protein [Cupriavidus pauculus]|uniref:hypothetical protein n=1 Tax=Cupriavidus pauculus TaxID=82633 RepID=UPI0030FBD303